MPYGSYEDKGSAIRRQCAQQAESFLAGRTKLSQVEAQFHGAIDPLVSELIVLLTRIPPKPGILPFGSKYKAYQEHMEKVRERIQTLKNMA